MTPFEPERYELLSGPAYDFDLDRRDFFKLLGGGIIVFSTIVDALAQGTPREIGGWLHIGEDGNTTVYTGKVEVGQNIRTSLTQVVCEELRLPMEAVQLVMGDTDLTPYDAGTFGSRTTPDMAPRLRNAAAAARELLIGLAAKTWNVDRAELIADQGHITQHSAKRSIGYSELTKGQKLMQTIETPPTTAAEWWNVCGKSAPKVNGRAIVTGRHKYCSDSTVPGMLYGKVLRPPSFGAKLESIDVRGAEAIPGVTVTRDGEFVGLTAPSERLAERALLAIRAQWKFTPQASERELFSLLRAGAKEPDLPAGSEVRLTASYTVAYIAHVPLEPRAAVAQWVDGKLTVWTGTQRPFGVRAELAQAFRIPESQVRVIMPDMGSGYGGKHTGEPAVEAARLASAARKPVKLVWTREEEFTWAYFRPAGVIDVASGVTKDGSITSWEFHNYNSGASGIQTLYDIPVRKIEFHRAQSPLKQGSYRALAATANHFARESHMDEIAHAVKMDPLEFRLKNLKNARLRAVLVAAAGSFGWGRRKPGADRGFGIAGGSEKGGYVATCAEVAIDRPTGAVKVVRIVTAFECGAIVNPDDLTNQIEGSMMMGLGGAMFEAIGFENGKILNARLSQYRVPRFSDTPVIETVLVDRKDLPSAGAGESTMIALAPAIGNAIFQATGMRLRSLPMAPNGLPTT